MQNSYILAALCSMCFYGFSDVVFKLSARYGIPSHRFIILQTIFFLPSALLFGLITNTIYIGVPFYYGMCAGITLYVSLLYFAISLSTGDVSVVAPVFRSSFVLSSALAILFLNEHATLMKISAFALSVIAAFLLLSQLKQGSSHQAPSPKIKNTTRNLVIASAFMGITGFIYKLGAIAGGNTISIVIGQAVVFFPLAFIACYVKEKKIVFVWKYLHLGFAAALCLFGGLFLLLEALKFGPASTIVPISQMSFVVSAITGIFLFKEKITWKKTLGLLCAVSAILLLAQ
jgi:uncharacterized membrane protein